MIYKIKFFYFYQKPDPSTFSGTKTFLFRIKNRKSDQIPCRTIF